MENIEGCDVMETVIIRLGDMFTQTNVNKHLVKNIETLQCLAANQAVTFPQTLFDQPCRTVKAWFPRDCEEKESTPCCEGEDTGCDIPFAEEDMPVECYEYGPNFCRTVSFGAFDDQCDSKISYQERLAQSVQKGMATLMCDWNAAVLTELASKPSAIELDPLCTDFVMDEETGAIAIPASYWTGDIVYDLNTIADNLQMGDYDTYVGSLLGKERWAAGKKGAGCCDSENAKFSDLPDMCYSKSQDTLLGEKCMFFVEKGAIGIFSTHQYGNTVPEFRADSNGGTWVYSQQLGNLTFRNGNSTQPIMVDIEYQQKCKTVTFKDGTCEKRWGIAGKIRLRGGIVCSPDDCNGFNGVLKFVCK